jgi:hypothetical protein
MDDPQVFLNAYLDHELTDDQQRAMTAWLAADPSNVERFVLQCYLHSQLQDIFTEERIASEALALRNELCLADFAVPAPCGPPAVRVSEVPRPVTEGEGLRLPPIPVLGSFGEVLRGVAQIGVFSYLVCAAMLLLGCFAVELAWEWGQGDRREIAGNGPSAVLATEERVLTGVGHISGMTSCQWAEGSQRPGFFDRVAIGQRFHLEAGLVEITYDTGFQAILQGPVQYEVTSANGGYLSVGKLTGKATTERARGFTVDTPSARVTDLGTEFGTEVAADGKVETVVFAGEVRLAPAGPEAKADAGQVLRKGQAAQVVPAADTSNPIVQLISAALDHRFTRAMPPTPVQMLIGPTVSNGSFEEPAVGPDNYDPEASNPEAKVYAKPRGVAPRYWNATFSLQTKGTVVQGVTDQQYVVLQGPSFVVLSTRFDGLGGHPSTLAYSPHTIYVLSADFGGDQDDMQGMVGFDNGSRAVRQAVAVSGPNVLAPAPPLVLNTDANPEFVGRPISVSFMKTGPSPQGRLYLDNVVLRAYPVSP